MPQAFDPPVIPERAKQPERSSTIKRRHSLLSLETFFKIAFCGTLLLAGLQRVTTTSSDFFRFSDGKELPQPTTVRIVRSDNGYQLTRDGQPYFIRGAGAVGAIHFDLLQQLGGNSIRTWAADGLEPVLDEANSKGITVMIGLWVAHGRHGFDYSNPKAVAKQLEDMRIRVRQYRNHPALLLWGVGNEAEGNGEDKNFWRALNDIAAMIKQEDPLHPTVTVVAEIGGPKVSMIKRLCPAIDILGVNSYKGLQTLPERLRKLGWNKPYILTEYGPPGPWSWEVATTKWGAPIEMTSTQKADYYSKGYAAAVASQSSRCLGSYAFIWGNKQEGTATWFGLLMPDGSMLASTLSISKLWTGKDPIDQAPEILTLQSKSFAQEVAPHKKIRVTLDTRHAGNSPLTVTWDLRSEKGPKVPGDDSEHEPAAHPIDAIRTSNNLLEFRAPKETGPYRLFVYVVDSHGYVATANMPFFVR